MKISYKRLNATLGTHVRIVSDAAFKKEELDGHSMRGALFIRCQGMSAESMQKTTIGHLINFVAKQQRRVVRATFTAELQAGCDSVDHGFLIVQTLHEMHTGEHTADQSRARRLHGGYHVPMILYLDAMSVYAAVTATFVKTPAEQGTLVHVQFLRELLDRNVLHAIAWVDTRDMLSDGLTKGSIDRKALHDVMNGLVEVHHEIKLWRPPHVARSALPAPSSAGFTRFQ